MIPKIIHYCWFGRNPLPDLAVKCIDSWRKFMPDYEIKEWNEDNFDVHMIPYTSQAYEAKKYAFVSDYARYWILYKYGGVYFDTDVEVVRSMDKIIQDGAFMGVEINGTNKQYPLVAPGLGMAIESGHTIYASMLNKYLELTFLMEDGTLNTETIVSYNTAELIRNGLKLGSEIQRVKDITIYPEDYFCPKDHRTGITTITKNTYSIHHYDGSWSTKPKGNRHSLKLRFAKIFGKSITNFLSDLITFRIFKR